MKKELLSFLLLLSTVISIAQPSVPRLSVADKKWQEGGIFFGKTPQQELLSARTEYTKKFERGNGLIDIYFGGPFHYADKNGILQDINLDIKPLYQAAFNYYNEENNFISRFGEIDARGVQMEYKNKMIAFGLMTKVSSGAWSPSPFVNTKTVVKNNSILYQNVYNNIDIGYEVTTEAIQHRMIFQNKEVFAGIQAGQEFVNIEEMIQLPKNAILSDRNGVITTSRDINGNLFVNVNGEIIFTIKEAYTWDASFNGNVDEQSQSANIIDAFKAVKTTVVILSPNTIRLVASIPVSWLTSSNRIFPIVFDPTVNVGNAGSFSSSYRYPFNTCRQQRLSQILFRKSDINAGGINTTGSITSIEFFQNTANPLSTNNIQVKMQEVPWNVMTTAVLTSGGWTDVYGPTNQNYTSGANTWRPLNLATPFNYTNTENLLVQVSFSNSTFTPGCTCDNTGPGGYWGWYNAPYAGHRWAYSTGAAPPPSGNTCNYNNSPEGNPAYGYFIPATRITINTTGGCVPITFTNHPSSQTVVAPAQAQFTVAVSGTTPTYQWEMSTNGGASWSNVPPGPPYSGITSNQLTINPTSAPLSNNRYRCRVTNSCTPTPVTSNTAVLTINAAGCTTAVTPPASPPIAAAGGPGSFFINVTPNTCSWSASETLTWVTITSPLSGTGDATLNYTVIPNNGGPRSGTITVNGQSHTINQLGAAAPTTYTISGRVIENGSVGIPNVVISTTPVQGPPVLTDAQGYYSINVPLTYTGTVKATLSPYTFMPQTQPVSPSSFSNKDFDAEAVSIKILPSSSIYPWQREGDDIIATINVNMGTTTTDWRLKADVYDANNVLTSVPFPSTNVLTYTINTSLTNPVQNQTFKNLCKKGSRVEYIAIYNPNPSITDTLKSSKIIEKMWNKKNVVYFNDLTNTKEIELPIKWIAGWLPRYVKIKRNIYTSKKMQGLNLYVPDYLEDNFGSRQFLVDNDGYCRINRNNSNIEEEKMFPGDFDYEIYYDNSSFIQIKESNSFDLTKVGKINGTTSNKILILIGGIYNEIEGSAHSLQQAGSGSADSQTSFSIIEYCRQNCSGNLATWYIAQGNSNYIIRNAYDIGLAINKIIELNPSVNEIDIFCHSKGGLDTRAMLSNNSELSLSFDGLNFYNLNQNPASNKIKKVLFFDTPHRGASTLISNIGFIRNDNLFGTPGGKDLKPTSAPVQKLNSLPPPLHVIYLNMTGYYDLDILNDGAVTVSDSRPVHLNYVTGPQLYQKDKRSTSPCLLSFINYAGIFCTAGYVAESFTGMYHMQIHKNAFLGYEGTYCDKKRNCIQQTNNLQKIANFIDNNLPASCDGNRFVNCLLLPSGSSVSGTQVFYKEQCDSVYKQIGKTTEGGPLSFSIIKSAVDIDSIKVTARGYDTLFTGIEVGGNTLLRLNTPLFKSGHVDSKIMYPFLGLIDQAFISPTNTVRLKITGKNVSHFFINAHNSDSVFVPALLTNNITTILLDTGYNRIIVRYVGVDTVYQQKTVYYLPDTLMQLFSMPCHFQTPTSLMGARLYVDNEFVKDIQAPFTTVNLLNKTNELKFTRLGYSDTIFYVDSSVTINLQMTPLSYSSLTDTTIFNFNNRANPQYWKTITVKNLLAVSNVQLSAKQYDDAFTGMSLKPQTRKFAFRRIGSASEAAYYKTAIALDQINTPDKDSVYLLSVKGNRYIKYLPNQAGVTEYDPEVQKVEFDKLDFTSNSTHEIVLMQKQAPLMKPMDTIWHSGQTLEFPISMFVTDPDSIKNDITASSTDVKVFVSGNIVYVTAPVNFTGATSFTVTGTHDWLDKTRTYTMKVIPPEVFIPTAFTPNNDGMNDILRPVFMGKLLYCHFSVFNRGGQKVFETKDCLAGWNGRIQGAEQTTGTFVYYLVYRFEGIKEEEKTAKGVFTLIK